MNRIRTQLFLYLIIFTGILSAQSTKHALIIAVGDYPAEGGWRKISSMNDVAIIRQALLSQGFNEKNVKTLTESAANYTGIKSEFSSLESRVKKDDIVLIHFSGHGQQIKDNNSDEVDGYDESIIPYDAHLIFKKGVYEGEKHFRDDELGKCLAKIQKKLGNHGNMIVILDACHSGTGTRGDRVSRGTDVKFQEEGYTPGASTRGAESGGFTEMNESDGTAPLVLISGASADQLNYEYSDKNGFSYGSLSFAFSKALTNSKKNFTYRTLFDIIQREMSSIAPYQMPQIEGQIDQVMFGGKVVEQVPYFTADTWINKNMVKIRSGILAGLYDNTIVGFYPEGTLDPEGIKPIATGTVVASEMLESFIKTDNLVTKDIALGSRIFIIKLAMGGTHKKVNIEKLISQKAAYNAMKALIDAHPNFELGEKEADFYVEFANKKFLVFNSMDKVLKEIGYSSNIPAAYADSAFSAIKTSIRSDLVRGLEMTDESINVSFEIIPISVELVNGVYKETSRTSVKTMTRGGITAFKDQQVFKIKIINNGSCKAYYQILDIKPNNEVDILLPTRDETPAEMYIAADTSKELPHMFIFGKPFGNEMFKLIATKEPTLLKSIVTTRGIDIREGKSLNPLEQLIQDTYSQTRANLLSVPPKSANIQSVVFIVKQNH